MTEETGLCASFSTCKPIMGKKLFQITFTVPIEHMLLATNYLGTPNIDDSKWFKIIRYDKAEEVIHREQDGTGE